MSDGFVIPVVIYLKQTRLHTALFDVIQKGQGPRQVMSQPAWLGCGEMFPFQEEALNDSY